MTNIDKLYTLAQDRPLVTNEIHEQNDFYGHATIIKKYCNLNLDYQLKTVITHSSSFFGSIWDVHLRFPLPGIIVWSQYDRSFLTNTRKIIETIGPPILYADAIIDEERYNIEQKQLGKCLLVFPAHSTHHVIELYDIHSFCNHIEEIGRDFNTIRVCLYWRDILSGLAEIYEQHGFECVTAGHMYDPLFLPRLRYIINSATITMSNSVGTHIGYCIALNKPHYIFKMPRTVIGKDYKYLEEASLDTEVILKITKEFSTLTDTITPKQYEIVEQYWGTNQIKTPQQLRTFLFKCEEIFQKNISDYTKKIFLFKAKQQNHKDSSTSSSLKSIIFSTQDSGGAAIAAYRLHLGLRKKNINSTFYVLNQSRQTNNITLFPLQHDEYYIKLPNSVAHPAFLRLQSLWKTIHSQYPKILPLLEAFSDYKSDANLELISEEINQADIINFHWISGMVDFEKYSSLLSNKIIVWTLHDMNPFTGGCHYSFDCQRYKQKCGKCPLLNSSREADITREIWLKKFIAYQHLNLTIVTPSKWLANAAKESSLFKNRQIHVIPYGIDENFFRPLNKKYIRDQYKIPYDKFVILFGAETLSNPRKGMTYLIKALKLLPQQNNDFIIATFGQPDKKLISAIPFPVISLGVLQENEMNKAYSLADVFVLPSLADNLPNTMLEALSCNIPVVAFNIGGVPDVIQHRQNGYLAPCKDEKELKNGIMWAYYRCINDNCNNEICRSTILSRYTLSHQAEKYITLYQQLLSKCHNA